MRSLLAATGLGVALLTACGGHNSNDAPDCRLTTASPAWLAFTSTSTGNYDLFLVRADGSCLLPLTTDTGADLSPAWAPGGAVGFQSSRAAIGMGIYLHHLDTRLEAQVPVDGLLAAAPAWSADGASIAFEGTVPGVLGTSVYTVGAAGGTPSRLTSDTGAARSAGPVWSPDGATIYFVSNRTGPFQIYSMGATGAGQAALSGTSGVLGRPAVSPDGTSLAYSRLGGASTAEVVVRTLATGVERVVSARGDSEPAFDATGKRLALTSTRGGRPAIWVVDAADGGHPVQVTVPTAVDGQPAFISH
jgi:TolB protein